MNDLLKNARNFTTKNIVKSRNSKKSSNDYIIDVLTIDEPMDRIDLNMRIAILRLVDVSEKRLNEAFINKVGGVETEEDIEAIKIYEKTYTTAKNGVDTSMARGQQKSNFCNSEYSTEYDLIKVGKMIKLIKK